MVEFARLVNLLFCGFIVTATSHEHHEHNDGKYNNESRINKVFSEDCLSNINAQVDPNNKVLVIEFDCDVRVGVDENDLRCYADAQRVRKGFIYNRFKATLRWRKKIPILYCRAADVTKWKVDYYILHKAFPPRGFEQLKSTRSSTLHMRWLMPSLFESGAKVFFFKIEIYNMATRTFAGSAKVYAGNTVKENDWIVYEMDTKSENKETFQVHLYVVTSRSGDTGIGDAVVKKFVSGYGHTAEAQKDARTHKMMISATAFVALIIFFIILVYFRKKIRQASLRRHWHNDLSSGDSQGEENTENPSSSEQIIATHGFPLSGGKLFVLPSYDQVLKEKETSVAPPTFEEATNATINEADPTSTRIEILGEPNDSHLEENIIEEQPPPYTSS